MEDDSNKGLLDGRDASPKIGHSRQAIRCQRRRYDSIVNVSSPFINVEMANTLGGRFVMIAGCIW